MNFRFDHPELLALLLLAIPIVWLGMRSLTGLEPARRWTAVALRLGVLGVLVLMLAGMQGVRRHTDMTLVVVRDVSESVRRFGRPFDEDAATVDQAIDRYLAAAIDAGGRRQTDRLGEVAYDDRAFVRMMPAEVDRIDAGAMLDAREGTDSAAGLRAGMAVQPGDTAPRMLLVSDGNDTSGDLLAAAREAAAAGVVVDVLPIRYRLTDEMMVDAVYAPTSAREGETAGVRVVLRATRPGSGVLRLYHDGREVGSGFAVREDDWSLENRAYDEAAEADGPTDARYIAVKQFDLPLAFTGVNQVRAVLEPDDAAGGRADTVAVNNRAEAFTLVSGEGRVLFVNDVEGASGDVLPGALRSRNINVDVIDPFAFPSRLGELQRYDAVIFQNVPQESITGPQQRMLARYVNDLGGGFAMIGGPQSFAAGAWTNTPVDKILPVECRVPSQAQLPSGALVVVIDRSGSMSSPVSGTNRTQQELANEAAVLALNTLFPQDLVGVVVFDSSATWVVRLQPNGDPAGVAGIVRSIQPGGGTNIYSGLHEAYRALGPVRTQDAAIRHVILLTDGQSTPPPGGSYIQLVAQMQREDISLSTIGVGDGHDAALLNQLARMGGGTYHPITNPNSLPQVFIKEAKTIRKNLVKEVEFVPALHATGSPIMTNIDAVPPLEGFILTGPKHDPRVFMPMTGPEGEPIFAHWQVGLGRTAAFTSDATNRWAVNWLPWEGYADFWARTVRTIARPTHSRNADLIADVRGEVLSLRLDTAAEGGFATVRGAVTGPDGAVSRVDLEQTGPGLYEVDVPAEASGNYVVTLIVQQPDGTRQTVFGGVSRPPGEELRRFNSNLPLLQQVAEITGGRVLDPADPQSADLYSREMGDFVTRSVRPLWRTLLVWLLVLVLLDVACRRIAWDPAAIAGWVRQRGRALFGSRRIEAEGTLAALKQRQAQVRDRIRAGAEGEDVPVRTAKFEADAAFVASDNVAATVGGAGAGSPEYEVTESEEEQTPAEEGTTTSRLLAAKRRARMQQRKQS